MHPTQIAQAGSGRMVLGNWIATSAQLASTQRPKRKFARTAWQVRLPCCRRKPWQLQQFNTGMRILALVSMLVYICPRSGGSLCHKRISGTVSRPVRRCSRMVRHIAFTDMLTYVPMMLVSVSCSAFFNSPFIAFLGFLNAALFTNRCFESHILWGIDIGARQILLLFSIPYNGARRIITLASVAGGCVLVGALFTRAAVFVTSIPWQHRGFIRCGIFPDMCLSSVHLYYAIIADALRKIVGLPAYLNSGRALHYLVLLDGPFGVHLWSSHSRDWVLPSSRQATFCHGTHASSDSLWAWQQFSTLQLFQLRV